MRNSRAIVLWAAFVTLAAGSAFAREGGTTDKLEITLVGFGCESVDKVFVVMLGNENEAMLAKKVAACHFTLNTAPKKFPSGLTHFSLRFAGQGRTRCRVPVWRDGMAQIEFGPLVPVEQITLMASPGSVSLPYVREVRGEGEYVACIETGSLPAGFGAGTSLWKIRDVDLKNETLRLRDFESKKDRCGLLVNGLQAIKRARKNGASVSLDRRAMAHALMAQRAGKDHCETPNLSSPATEITERELEKRELATISVTVN